MVGKGTGEFQPAENSRLWEPEIDISFHQRLSGLPLEWTGTEQESEKDPNTELTDICITSSETCLEKANFSKGFSRQLNKPRRDSFL